MQELTPQIRLSFGPSAQHVRTARLVAVAAVRRHGRSDDVVEAVRQAVGEACVLALGAARPDQRISLEIDDRLLDGSSLAIRVWPVVGMDTPGDAWPRAVMASLTDSIEIASHNGQFSLELRWIE